MGVTFVDSSACFVPNRNMAASQLMLTMSRSELAEALGISLRSTHRYDFPVVGRRRKGRVETNYSIGSVISLLEEENPTRSRHEIWPAEGRYLAQNEAAQYLGRTSNALRLLRSRGRGPKHVNVGGNIRFRLEDLDAWMTEEKV